MPRLPSRARSHRSGTVLTGAVGGCSTRSPGGLGRAGRCSQPHPALLTTRTNPLMGAYLVNGRGFTLYTFALDTTAKSPCSGVCAKEWPPVLVPKGAKLSALVHGVKTARLGKIKRADGTFQLTYEGKPLYLFVGDKRPGQTVGQGFANVWSVARVSPTKEAAVANSLTPTPTAPPAPTGTGPGASTSSSSGSTGHTSSGSSGSGGSEVPTPPPTNSAPPTSPPAPSPTPTSPPPTTPPNPPPTGGGGGGGGGYGH